MAQKRSCEDQLPNDFSSKHPRQTGERDIDVSHVGMVSLKAPFGKDIPSGEESFMVNGVNGSTPGVPDDEDVGVRRSQSPFPWAASSTCEPLAKTECFRFDRLVNSPLRTTAASPSPLRADNLYSVLDNPPRKPVPVGPDHQADIPVLSNTASLRDDYNKLAGNSVIPNNNDPEITTEGSGKADCQCPDVGSIRCVRQHINEAREKLVTSLGEEAFIELGFHEMGEVVSEKWSKDDQQLFHKVVQCNPFSLGNNFWRVLSAVFPSRTKMEIVSYYFNVLMLQKRAEQNRHDPSNIDSDNDEWQLSSDDDDDDVDSPAVYHDDSNNDYPLDDDRDISKFGCDDIGGHNFSDSVQPHGRVWQDLVLEPCHAKTWDDYVTCPKDELDFLPTCSMIQEVFGDGPLDSDAKTR